MGYDLHITRADDWTESETKPITLDEWKIYVAQDPEFVLEGYASARVEDGAILTYESEGLAVWTAFSEHDQDGNKAWFDHQNGAIIVKNPNDEIISKVKIVARQLRAHVVGDEGERY